MLILSEKGQDLVLPLRPTLTHDAEIVAYAGKTRNASLSFGLLELAETVFSLFHPSPQGLWNPYGSISKTMLVALAQARAQILWESIAAVHIVGSTPSNMTCWAIKEQIRRSCRQEGYSAVLYASLESLKGGPTRTRTWDRPIMSRML